MEEFLTSKLIYLRPWKETDIEMLSNGINNQRVRDTLYTFRPKSKIELEEEIKRDLVNDKSIMFTICECGANLPVGITAYYRIDSVSRAAVFFLAIYDTTKWGKSYGSEATKLMVDYAFNILNLNRIQLHVASDNPKAVSIYEKCGFVKEGTLREAMYHNNQYIDFYVMGILRSDFYKK